MLTKKEALKAIKEHKEHYVYALCRGDTNEPFYIGKGKNKRLFDHVKINGQNPYKDNVINKHGISGYIIFDSFDTAKEAFELEIEIIAYIGLMNLTNIGKGGEGQDPEFASNFTKQQWADPNSKIRRATQTDEYKAKISIKSSKMWDNKDFRKNHAEKMKLAKPAMVKALKKYFESPEARYKAGNGSRGRVQPQEEIDQRSIAVSKAWNNEDLRKSQSIKLKEVSNRPEQKINRSKASLVRWDKPGARKPVMCIETGDIFQTTALAAEWCGKSIRAHIGSVCRGKRKTAGGYHWEYVDQAA